MSPSHHYTHESVVDGSVAEVFGWHEQPGVVQRLTPPWEPVRVERAAQGLQPGERTVFRTCGPERVTLRWVAEHTDYRPPHEFRDVQVSGPFSSYEHHHRFSPADDQPRTRVTDEVSYTLPAASLGEAAARILVQPRLRRWFDYRHRQLVGDLAAHRRARERGVEPMHVAVAGASGLIGSTVAALLAGGGHRVTRLVRRDPAPGEVFWDPATGRIDADGLRGVDAVINLAGAPIGGRWTAGRKRRVRDSRVGGTRLLARTMAELDGGPRVFVCGSAVGYYGYDRGDEPLTEESGSGTGFLADVVREWEAAADPARAAGLRVVHVRTGLVLTPAGGVLQLQLPPFLLGAGGRLGSGRQWMSWVGIDDIAGLFHHALTTPGLSGVVNGTAPRPVTNAEFSRVLGRVLGRPSVVPVPKLGPSLLLTNEGATETALASQRALPVRPQESGYEFRHPDVETALRHVLGRHSLL